MNKTQYNEIISLSESIFDDNGVQKVNSYLEINTPNSMNSLRLYVSQELELLEALSELNTYDQVAQGQLLFCNKLEDLILNLVIEQYIT